MKAVLYAVTRTCLYVLHHTRILRNIYDLQHISVQAEVGGKSVRRSYTPTSSDDDLGHFDLLIKVM